MLCAESPHDTVLAHALNSAFCAARAAILASIAARTAAASSSSTPSGTCSGIEAGAIAGAASGGEANTSAAGAGAAPKATRDGAEVGLRAAGLVSAVATPFAAAMTYFRVELNGPRVLEPGDCPVPPFLPFAGCVVIAALVEVSPPGGGHACGCTVVMPVRLSCTCCVEEEEEEVGAPLAGG